ncbi:MAG: zinc metallopeptidase [Chloroflexi bacterium RBG_16_63_12]|jgi:Zn-dependent membrane protease YugP|nr:Zinc metallopeptidase [Anaerolineales bacterium]MBM2849520.1 Zinc metallopeptidase [Anaerolineales bacterium]OGO50447.1 MAG: zinc metallopeptidase [Chloroflexi bacterium RBG_16_63_12]
MFYFNPLYLVFSLPALLLALIAQWRVQAAINKYSRVYTGRGATGARVARAILDGYGLQHVAVERTSGFLGDHYDPLSRTLRLSPEVHDTPSVAAVGIAAHETGHALQHAEGYWPLQARSAIVPVVQFGSYLGPLVFLLGFLLNFTGLAWAGVFLFAGVAVFALITLPVEFDASRRAKELLASQGYAWGEELSGVSRVLDAAALTYVAGLAQALSTLLYYVFLLTGFRRRE